MAKKAEESEIDSRADAENVDEILARLDALVSSLEKGDLPLEKSFETFKNGMELYNKGLKRLAQIEKQVQIILDDDGTTADFEPAAGRAKEED